MLRDPMLKMIKPKLTGSLRGLIFGPKPTTNVLEALRRLSNLIFEAGFTAGTFNKKILLDRSDDRVIATGQSLIKTLSPLIGIRDPGDNQNPLIYTTDRQTPRVTMDQVITPTNDYPKDEHTGSSHYASASQKTNRTIRSRSNGCRYDQGARIYCGRILN